ncbi:MULTISPECIES: IDEAL domain-containing protein [unclassified Virgibacillus]|uniref:IDEAL domain-containing protein n=1 Tax=unclassified Virgibacillus TaxID=2620237 RepID=UPI0024DE9D6F|nr:IDEAL domain-containing protein [Virgibacillus sp. LDC-1]
MVTVKLLKPYYIKSDEQNVIVVLAYQYFAMFINHKVYQFIPVEEKEIRINRVTRKIENVGARFAFQKGKDIIYMSMSELISLPDFLRQLNTITAPYFEEETEINKVEQTAIIRELEQLNVKRLIDKALDERDETAFRQLMKLL